MIKPKHTTQTHQTLLSRMLKSVYANKTLFSLIIAYIIVVSTVCILREQTFLTSGFDLGIFNQALSTTTSHGLFFYETGDLSFNPYGNFFGVHFSPILFLMLPFYAIYPAPESLLVMQTFILAIGAAPLYWIAKDKLGSKTGLVIAAIYLCNPLLWIVNLNDFHLEAFTSTFFLFSLYFLLHEHWGKFAVFLILALSTIEFAPIISVFLLVYAAILMLKGRFVTPKKKIIMIITSLFLVSVLWFLLALAVKGIANPSTSPVPSPFHSLLQNPSALLVTDSDTKMHYVLHLFGTLAFLPLLAPEVLIMVLPWVGASLFSAYPAYYSIYYQYQGFVIPFLFIALIEGLNRMRIRNAKKIFAILALATCVSSFFFFTASNVPWNYQWPIADERTRTLHDMLQLVPANASILTQNDIFPHVSNRPDAYMYLPTNSSIAVDYILVDVGALWYRWEQPNIFGERSSPQSYAQQGLESGAYGIYASASTIMLLKKNYTDIPVLFTPYYGTFNSNNLFLDNGSIVSDTSSSSKNVFFYNTSDKEEPFWHGPYIDLPSGYYKVTYTIKANETVQPTGHLLLVDVTADSGKVLLAQKEVSGHDALENDDWFNVTVHFYLLTPTDGIEFRGIIAGNSSVYFDYLTVQQLSTSEAPA